MGDINPGDVVFDECGKPCNVTAVFDSTQKSVYRVSFSDGSSLLACEEHQWTTWQHRDRKEFYRDHGARSSFPEKWTTWSRPNKKYRNNPFGPRVRTTKEILETIRYGNRGDLNHSIPVCRAIQTQEQWLPIDPWLFGYWLGDGTSASAEITVGPQDYDWFLSKAKASGFNLSTKRDRTAYRVNFLGMIRILRKNRVLNRKHVPQRYLWSSPEHRLALLRGLMDSDGHASPRSQVEFCSTNEKLAESVLFLARSLGERPTLNKGVATLNGIEVGPKYRVCWSPNRETPFLLPRKRARCKVPSENPSVQHRMITDITPVPSRPVRCISVDSTSRMYLAGEAMIPTHNTRTEGEFAHDKADEQPGSIGFVAARTLKDARKTIIGNRKSGIIATARPGNPVIYKHQESKLVWKNGTTADVLTSEEPDSARGPEYDWGVADEIATWKRVVDFEGNTLWDNLQFALRGGAQPQMVCGTTPRRNSTSVKYLVAQGAIEGSGVIVTRGSMLENSANLPDSYVQHILRTYGGTHLARQEVEGELLPDVEGAIVTSEIMESCRVDEAPRLKRIIVGVDPSGGKAEQGIVAVGLGWDNHGYVLQDATCLLKPEGWGRRAVDTYKRWNCDRIVAERNYGGDMVESTIRTVDPKVPVTLVTASRGKHVRFEPVGSLYEQRMLHHVGEFAKLEDEICCFTPDGYEGDDSPNRGDALVWAVTDLMLGSIGGVSPEDLYGDKRG